ncbi:hypothetical protein F511_47487 [Dorcoceras hygrometricum]|uniref:Uncharacterized protein n=1 Tax=Dorcoceras hygrometricum TaxID=472368 RepID=A0A2Z6ZY54_9LAMI|nr:hypothetical protein F511_47487 [Dorcoceras hygrometricum]
MRRRHHARRRARFIARRCVPRLARRCLPLAAREGRPMPAGWPAASCNWLRLGRAQRRPSCSAWRGQRAAVCRTLCDGGGRRRAVAVRRFSGSAATAFVFYVLFGPVPGSP